MSEIGNEEIGIGVHTILYACLFSGWYPFIMGYGRGTSPRHGSSSRHPAYKLPFARRVETIYAQD